MTVSCEHGHARPSPMGLRRGVMYAGERGVRVWEEGSLYCSSRPSRIGRQHNRGRNLSSVRVLGPGKVFDDEIRLSC